MRQSRGQAEFGIFGSFRDPLTPYVLQSKRQATFVAERVAINDPGKPQQGGNPLCGSEVLSRRPADPEAVIVT